MVRFLTITALIVAILVGLCGLASRFTITVTVRPIEAPQFEAPSETQGLPSTNPAALKPPRKAIDSHHTKGA